eukprot:8778655-Lingulodinium_polyedra.AAC.1
MSAQHKGLLLPGEGRARLLRMAPKEGRFAHQGVAEPPGAAGAAAAGARCQGPAARAGQQHVHGLID